jgi:hypothetical protein
MKPTRNILAALATFASLGLANFATAAEPTRITRFDDLMAALKSGKTVRGVYDYSKCTIRSEDPNTPSEPGPSAIGGNTFATWEFFAKGMMGNANGFVSTSETVLITHRRYGYVYNYGRTKVLDDGRVEMLIEYLDAKTMEVKMHEIIDCKMSDGLTDNFGAQFFAQ